MTTDLKEIYLGHLIKQRVSECDISVNRICKFLKCTEEEVEKIYKKESIETEQLLKLSKLLEYDFFRLYSQHLILYSSLASVAYNSKTTKLPFFKKNIYTKEIIEFILDLLETKQKSKAEIIKEYGIPKTTLYKWVSKYKK
ncbi:transposase [Chryseobacterium sp. BIGb0232]|uniref:transposase n=1 Tax=Chryseobacterium sp. BIGb0232 TaxID=2940598 RepID=UPI000F4882EA|nr:transposase [Chryseobacterium sp. BIGb0232]MCS4302868.1 DNA invertase Pin-like site-specific DNA recombinase [Chryseobacterium sp. BIGb0232]ROS17520.1 CENP-B-like protein [Chryseobacterium nakagawai]